MIWTGAEEGDSRRVLRQAVEPLSARRGTGYLRGYVGTIPPEYHSVVAEVQNHLRQVPHHEARGSGRGRSASGQVLSQRRTGTGVGEGQALAAADALGAPDHAQEAATQCPVCVEPEGDEGHLLKKSLDRLWSYCYEGAMSRYLNSWIDQLRWQRLKPMEKLADMLLNHLEGILNYCRTKAPWESSRQ